MSAEVAGCTCCGRPVRSTEQIAEHLLLASKRDDLLGRKAATQIVRLQEGLAELSYELVGYCRYCATIGMCPACRTRRADPVPHG